MNAGGITEFDLFALTCSQRGTEGQMKCGQGPGKDVSAEELFWHVVPGAEITLSRQEDRVPDWPLRSPGGMQNT